MPWKETQIMDQRIEFAMKAVNCGNFRSLCQDYGISPKTGYKWRDRFLSHGVNGLEDMSRRPHRHAEQLSEEVICEMVSLKQAHRPWGPRKIRDLYLRRHNGQGPSESSFKRVLERAGLTQPRKKRRSHETGRLSSARRGESPNEVWTVDFKGWWYGRDGQRVEPLTVRDEFSRMILDVRAVANARTETVKSCFEQLFENHGLPGAIRSDNGPPFASHQGLFGLTRLSAWWLALGIDLERGRPGCPQDNGAHERMHLDIMRELESGRMGRDQEAFDTWRHEFNTERPHEALGMARPAEVYGPSVRPYTGTPDEIDYGEMETRRVNSGSGVVCYHGESYALSTSLGGWNVGLAPCGEIDQIEVWFSRLLLGHIDPRVSAFKPLPMEQGCHRGDSATLRRHDGSKSSPDNKQPKV